MALRFIAATAGDGSRISPVAAATEVLLRYLTAEHPNIPILVIESDCRSTNSSLAHEMVAMRYGVPFLAYAHALTNKTGCTKSAWHLNSHSRVHPLWDMHATLGEMLAQWWQAFSASLPTSESEPGNGTDSQTRRGATRSIHHLSLHVLRSASVAAP